MKIEGIQPEQTEQVAKQGAGMALNARRAAIVAALTAAGSLGGAAIFNSGCGEVAQGDCRTGINCLGDGGADADADNDGAADGSTVVADAGVDSNSGSADSGIIVTTNDGGADAAAASGPTKSTFYPSLVSSTVGLVTNAKGQESKLNPQNQSASCVLEDDGPYMINAASLFGKNNAAGVEGPGKGTWFSGFQDAFTRKYPGVSLTSEQALRLGTAELRNCLPTATCDTMFKKRSASAANATFLDTANAQPFQNDLVFMHVECVKK